MKMKNCNLKGLSSTLTKDEAGNLLPARRFMGGAYDALTKKPRSLLSQNSYYRRILLVLGCHAHEKLSTRVITKLYNAAFKEQKSPQSLNARLSSLYVYGLVQHHDDADNLGGGTWSIADDINATDGQSLYDRAVRQMQTLKGNSTP